jgi:hypothetical protein
MKTALAIAVFVIFYLWWAKRRLNKKMHRLVNAAKLTSYGIFTAHLSDTHAAASVNFLFGEPPSPLHESLNLREIHAHAIESLKSDDLLRELIVQSLRVATQLGFMKNGAVEVRGENILKTFGPAYSIPPNPDTYEHLVQRSIDTLSPEMQMTIRSRFGLVSHE